MSENTTPGGKTKHVVVTRLFDAPVERVWNAWADAEQVKRWWGPDGFTAPVARIDFREGGTSLVCMRSPDGQDFYNTWAYQNIVPMQRIEYIQNLADQDGQRIDPVTVGLREDFPEDVQTVVTFTALGEQTEVTMVEYGFPDSVMFEYAEMGLNQCLDKMAASFAGA